MQRIQSSLISPVKRSANEDKRNSIIKIATAKLGVREATGNNNAPFGPIVGYMIIPIRVYLHGEDFLPLMNQDEAYSTPNT